jgi:hypothetical protein
MASAAIHSTAEEIRRVGEYLVTCCWLLVGSRSGAVARYKIVEVELYVTSPRHPDPYTHCHPEQLGSSLWYLHRSSPRADAAHREGTYKGLDVAIGTIPSAGSPGEHAGALIRSVMRSSDGLVINGPCLVVEELLRHAGAQSARDYAAWLSEKGPLTTLHPELTLGVSPASNRRDPAVLRSPRVGLRVKRPAELEYRWERYRFVSGDVELARRVKKGSELTLASLLLEGSSPQQAAALAGTTRARAEALSILLDTARTTSPSACVGAKLDRPADLVSAYAAWATATDPPLVAGKDVGEKVM